MKKFKYVFVGLLALSGCSATQEEATQEETTQEETTQEETTQEETTLSQACNSAISTISKDQFIASNDFSLSASVGSNNAIYVIATSNKNPSASIMFLMSNDLNSYEEVGAMPPVTDCNDL